MHAFRSPGGRNRRAGSPCDSVRVSHLLPGFTLMELAIAVAIAAVIAAIAWPSYAAYQVRAHRAAAQAFLLDLAFRQQQHFLARRGYTADLDRLGVTAVPAEVAAWYAVSIPALDNAASPPAFSLVATPHPGTMQARDGALGVDSTGARSGKW